MTLVALLGFVFLQHRQQQQALRRQEKRNREVRKEALRERDQLLDALGDAFLLVNETSHIVFANACARKLVKGRRLMGRSIMEAFLDDQLSVAIMKCVRTGKPMQERVTLHSTYTPLGSAGGQGGSAWVIDAAPLASHGDAALTRVVIRDVTIEYQADQVRRDFVANASHELRTPMSIINGYLENLLDDDVLEEPVMARKFLGTMRKHGQRISRLVEDMLVISKMESGESMVLNQEAFGIDDCVQDVRDRLESMISHQQAQVVIDVQPEALQLTGDRFYWTQILFNLVENALKQNPRHGLQVAIKARKDDEVVTLSVCDDGVGIPAADLPYVFKRFYRVEKHHSQSGIKGTGLGLSIVRRAIEAHGGEIRATSVPGQQTCFTITVPEGEGHSADRMPDSAD
ncbi:MAG: PAS domain-containing protein [Verrucomicrobiae bacterium]|nr:PAS domain-containing protein [Verrucomicrobiae bacterium]NNJ43896.1 PAS domain-containing protein [Akkermansiaceae bacterium]